MSIAEYYGWAFSMNQGEKKKKAECMSCGDEMDEQRGSVIYECERCMNEHIE